MTKLNTPLILVLLLIALILPLSRTSAATADVTKEEANAIVANLQSCGLVLSQDLTDLSKKVDFSSFLGKTVKIPIPSGTVSKIPGGDTDFLYINPPKLFKNTKTGKSFWYPLTSTFLSDGPTISKAKEDIVKNQVEAQIATAFAGKKDLLIQLKDIVVKQMGMKNVRPISQSAPSGDSLWDFIFKQVKAANNSIDDTIITNDSLTTSNANVNAADLAAELGLDTSNGTDLSQMFDMNDAKTQQLFMLLLMNFVLSQKAAEASGVDKTACLAAGGEWINETCVTETATANCASGEIDFSDLGVGDGECHAASDLKASCQAGEGTWFQRTGTATEEGSAFCKGTKTMTFNVNLTSSNSNANSSQKNYICTCPDTYCGDPTGKCLSPAEVAGDTDKDGAVNGKDKCVSTASGESVNMDETSSDYGCSCTDLQKKGRLQPTTCPPSECRGQYWIQYPTQVDTSSLCSDGFIQSAANLCTPTQTMTQQCVDLQNQQNNSNQNNSNSNSDIMKQIQDMMNQLSKGGGSSGGGGSGGGSSGGSSGGCPPGGTDQNSGSPSSPSEQKPSTPSKPPVGAKTENGGTWTPGQYAADSKVQEAFEDGRLTREQAAAIQEGVDSNRVKDVETAIQGTQELSSASTAYEKTLSDFNAGKATQSQLDTATERMTNAIERAPSLSGPSSSTPPSQSMQDRINALEQQKKEITDVMGGGGVSPDASKLKSIDKELNDLKNQQQIQKLQNPKASGDPTDVEAGKDGPKDSSLNETQQKSSQEEKDYWDSIGSRSDGPEPTRSDSQLGDEFNKANGIESDSTSPTTSISPFDSNMGGDPAPTPPDTSSIPGAYKENIPSPTQNPTMEPMPETPTQANVGSPNLSSDGTYTGGPIGDMSAQDVQSKIDSFMERGFSMEEIGRILETMEKEAGKLNNDNGDLEGEPKQETPAPGSNAGDEGQKAST